MKLKKLVQTGLCCLFLALPGSGYSRLAEVDQTLFDPSPRDSAELIPLGDLASLFPSDSIDMPAARPYDLVKVKVTALDSRAAETDSVQSPDSGVFVISLSRPLSYSLPVFFTISGTASNGLDYARLTSRIIIPAGAVSGELLIIPRDDTQVEPTESVVITLEPSPLSSVPPYEPDPPGSAVITIEDNDAPVSRLARIELLQPKDGARFAVGRAMEFQAVAVDPAGYISYVEFLANNRKIGESRIFFIRAPDPGTPIAHQFLWTNVPPGHFVVKAIGISTSGAKVISNEAEIVVENELPYPQLSVIPVSPYLLENNTNLAAQYTGFRLVRSGPADSMLRVPVQITGTAVPGVDYVRLTNVFAFLPGEKELFIPVTLIDDSDFEPAETITMQLRSDLWTDPLSSFAPGISLSESNVATIYLLDNDLPSTHPGIVQILKPDPEARLATPSRLMIEVIAADPVHAHPGIPLVEIYANDRKIGDALSPISSIPKPGTPILFQMVWTNPPPGSYLLTGRATNHAGKRLISSPVSLTLTSSLPLITVTAVDPTATEGQESDSAVFLVSRPEPAADGLTILYRLSGTASNGVDYVKLPELLHFSAGEKSAEIIIRPLDDQQREGDETVILTLFLSALRYGLGFPSNAMAIIKDNDGSPVNVSMAWRFLPDTYTPGHEFTVRIEVKPLGGALVYGLEDAIPEGWSVSNISHEGVFDPFVRKIKYGPFTDPQSRVLTYRVTPPFESQGIREFSGLISIDGQSSPIAGDRLISPMQPGPHPADLKPEDWRMTLDEVTAYTVGWLKGQTWPNGPNPIPANYATRAAVLWKEGEHYKINTDAGGPPQWWIPSMLLHGTSPEAQKIITPLAAFNSAMSDLPLQYKPGVPLTVTITVQPDPDTLTYAVQDQPPQGWLVSAINEEGQLDLQNGQVKWFFFDEEPRTLTYTVTPPLNASGRVEFEGLVSFDSILVGPSVPITGQRESTSRAPSSPLSFGIPFSQDGGTISLEVHGLTGGLTAIEATANGTAWSQQTVLTNVTGATNIVVPIQDSDQFRFFRARTMP